MTGADYDAVVVGAGPNGLVAANRLADAGWDLVVLDPPKLAPTAKTTSAFCRNVWTGLGITPAPVPSESG